MFGRIWKAVGQLAENLEKLAGTVDQIDSTVRTRLHLDTPIPNDEPVLLEGEPVQEQDVTTPAPIPARKRKGGAA